MNKSELFEILQKLNSLSTYGELFPTDFKGKYLNDLAELKVKINEFSSNTNVPPTENQSKPVLSQKVDKKADASNIQMLTPVKNTAPPPAPFPLAAPPPPAFKAPPPLSAAMGKFNIKKTLEPEIKNKENDLPVGKGTVNSQNLDSRQADLTEESLFSNVLESLVPKLTDEGHNILADLSFSIDLYKILKMIDDKTPIYQLFLAEGHNYKNFLEFMSPFLQLEAEKYITLVKNKEQVQNKGWIRIGEIFSEGKVTSPINIDKAFNHQKTKKDFLIGEALVDLKCITQNSLKEGLRIQRWLSKVTELSAFQKILNDSHQEEAQKHEAGQQSGKTTGKNKKYFSNILDFIIPMLNEKGMSILNDPEHRELAARIKIVDGKASLLSIFEANKTTFQDNKLAFLKFIFKLESQDILFYRKNPLVQEREVWVKYGTLLLSLGIVTETQLQIALSFKLGDEKMRNMYIGETLAELKLVEPEILQECLKIHKYVNEILAKISYENAFAGAIETVLQDTFHKKVDLGIVKKVAFTNPLSDMICTVYPIRGKLNGNIYYILDRSFMNNLSKTLRTASGRSDADLASNGKIEADLDANVITEISNMITESSLKKLENIGISCETSAPQIIMDEEIIIADKKMISVIPLMSDLGRFTVGLEISE
jgi:CheY-specific phosphatase CheX